LGNEALKNGKNGAVKKLVAKDVEKAEAPA